MADALTEPAEALSSWWKVAALATMAAGFAVLILLTAKAYQNAPPIPDRFVDPTGAVVFTADDVIAGQQVFLKHGLMDNGTIWGHGGYLGPDFSAQSLHILALELAVRIARERLGRGYTDLNPEEKAAIDGAALVPAISSAPGRIVEVLVIFIDRLSPVPTGFWRRCQDRASDKSSLG